MNATARPAAASIAPYFEDLEVGQLVTEAPALTLTPGHAATHQAILGDRLRLALDAELSARRRRSRTPAWSATSRSANRPC